MKNPNGFGTVIKTKDKRRKPWRAIKTIGFDPLSGKQKRKTIGYFETKIEALENLCTYKTDPYVIEVKELTLDNVYNQWKELHFKKISKPSQTNYEGIYTHFAALKNKKFSELKIIHLQEFINSIDVAESTKRNIKNLIAQLYKYALKYDIVEKDYSKFIELGKVEKILERKIFSNEEIMKLWMHIKLSIVDTVLIMIYTGLRIGELLLIKNQDIDIKNRTIIGGIKTKAGKNRIIPINTKILPLIQARISSDSNFLIVNKKGEQLSYQTYQKCFKKLMLKLNMQHTIHDCRHTFASLLSNADANKTAIAKIIGHSNYETTEKIYTHKDIEELKKAIDLI